MNKKTLTIIVISNLAVCLISVCATYYYLGWWVNYRIEKADEKLNQGISSSLFRYYSNVDLQQEYGGPDKYRKALIAFSKALDETKAQAPNNPLLSDDVIYTDKTLIFVRLALLEEGQGNFQKADSHKCDAIAFCKKIPWDDCTFEKLNRVYNRLDEKYSVIKPKKNP